MKCIDCIHCEVCAYVSPFLPTCSDFKNKSKYIELPCAVGETVYLISEKYDPFDMNMSYGIIETPFKPNLMNLIGKVIFLTKEEAEKKIKGEI